MRRITYIPEVGTQRFGRSFAWYPRTFYEQHNGKITWIWLEWYEWIDTYYGQGEWYRYLRMRDNGVEGVK